MHETPVICHAQHGAAALATMLIGAIVAVICIALAGCVAPAPSNDDAPAPAFGGSQWNHAKAAIQEKDPDSILVAAVMESYAIPGDVAPTWTYLAASQKYAKFFMITNHASKATTSIYGPSSWNSAVWEEARSTNNLARISIDAQEAYRKIIAKNPELQEMPYMASIMTYEPAIEATENAPELLTWYFYFTTTENLAHFDSSAETAADIASTTAMVDAINGDVSIATA